jgi:hypothetical protein
METRLVCLCHKCKQVISHPDNGFIVEGNIREADPGGLIGYIGTRKWLVDAENDPQGKVSVSAVPTTAYCRFCFLEALGLEEIKIRDKLFAG